MQICPYMIDKALEEAFDQGIVPDGKPDSRAKIEAVLSAGLTGIGFDGLVEVANALLAAKYPETIFTGASSDPGPIFIAKLREALAVLTATA